MPMFSSSPNLRRRTIAAAALYLAPLLVTVAAPTLRAEEEAERRVGPLVDAPAIRHRVELRDKRFEIGAGVGTTVGQDFYHAVLLNLKLGFHLTDWLAISAVLGQNITPGFKTAFTDKLEKTLPTATNPDNRAPSKKQALDGMNKIAQVIGLQGEIAPFAGKFSLFGKFFANYDLYVFGGPGFINFQSDGEACTAGTEMVGGSCPVTGFKMGATFGGGFHAFINDFVAINAEFRDIMVRNNPAGRDATGDDVATDKDLTWDQNFMILVNAQFFLPGKAKVSD